VRGKKPEPKIYALDEGELTATLDRLRRPPLYFAAGIARRLRQAGC